MCVSVKEGRKISGFYFDTLLCVGKAVQSGVYLHRLRCEGMCINTTYTHTYISTQVLKPFFRRTMLEPLAPKRALKKWLLSWRCCAADVWL